MTDLAKGFLVLCDKDLENDVGRLVAKLQAKGGEISLKTYDAISEAKGKSFADKLKTILKWSHAVIIISSKNFSTFVDKKDKDHLPDLLKKNHKDFHKVFSEFLKDETKKIPHRLIPVSVNGDETLPKAMVGMPLVKNNGNEDAFVNEICSQIAAKINQ